MKSNKKVELSRSENPLPDQEQISPEEIQPKKPTLNWLKIALPALAFVLVITLAITIYYSSSLSKLFLKPVTKQTTIPIIYPTPTPTPTRVVSDISGNAITIPTDLQLITYNNKKYPITYYEAGTFTSGKYAGYKRIIATFASNLGSGKTRCDNTMFLTKNDEQYIGMPIYIGTSAYTKRVTEIKSFDNSIPDTIRLSNNDIITDHNSAWAISMNDDNFNCTLITDTNSYLQLSSPSKNYRLYATNNLNNSLLETTGKYFVKDQAGVLFTYLLDKEMNIDSRTLTWLKTDHHSLTNLFSSLYGVGNDSGAPLYKEKLVDDPAARYFLLYGMGLSNGFKDPAYTPDFSNVKAADFTQIFLIENKVPLYVLKESINTTSIYQTRYKKLLLRFAKNPAQMPTYEEYIKNHPFVFLKDPFGRYILYEEGLYFDDSGITQHGK